jgi:hypothetical protein
MGKLMEKKREVQQKLHHLETLDETLQSTISGYRNGSVIGTQPQDVLKFKESWLHAADNGLIRHMQQLYECRGELAPDELLSCCDINGNTALHMVVLAGRPEAISWLLRRGADRGAKNDQGHTAYDIALSQKQLECEHLLHDQAIGRGGPGDPPLDSPPRADRGGLTSTFPRAVRPAPVRDPGPRA